MNSIRMFKQDFNCSICFEDFHEGKGHLPEEKISHVFCKCCLEKWLERDLRCPLCQKSLQEKGRGNSFVVIPILEERPVQEIGEARELAAIDSIAGIYAASMGFLVLSAYYFFS